MRTPLMANRGHVTDGTVEAELVVVDTDDPKLVILELDDGAVVELDRGELTAALAKAA